MRSICALLLFCLMFGCGSEINDPCGKNLENLGTEIWLVFPTNNAGNYPSLRQAKEILGKIELYECSYGSYRVNSAILGEQVDSMNEDTPLLTYSQPLPDGTYLVFFSSGSVRIVSGKSLQNLQVPWLEL